MGQNKIKVIDLSLEAKEKKALEKEKTTKPKVQTVAKKTEEKKEETKTSKRKKIIKQRSKKYQILKLKIDKTKLYSPQEAFKLLCEIKKNKANETVEIHLNLKEKISGFLVFPHPFGKKQKVAIADDKLISQIEKGKINFDILVASPQIMPKLAKVAKILGPKGLMPNPKTGTIGSNPEEIKEKLEKGQVKFKTEPKFPLLHLAIGKISLGPERLLDNFKALLSKIPRRNILKAFITSTQSPSIKIEI